MTTDPALAARQRWLALLARAPREELERAAQTFGVRGAAVPVRSPECGMVMLRGRTGGTGDAFNLGEATVTRTAVRVGTALGVGYVLGRDRARAELVALFDALLQDPARRPVLMQQLVDPLAAQQAGARAERSRAAAASRVEFFTMVRGESA
ncbi:MAG TPA: phosphonate C-P lyase system protein PhnG [Ramlibacter sp.]|nr:phosphonate C-P lyase system protein PhnG [Ramlibacter sp.]